MLMSWKSLERKVSNSIWWCLSRINSIICLNFVCCEVTILIFFPVKRFTKTKDLWWCTLLLWEGQLRCFTLMTCQPWWRGQKHIHLASKVILQCGRGGREGIGSIIHMNSVLMTSGETVSIGVSGVSLTVASWCKKGEWNCVKNENRNATKGNSSNWAVMECNPIWLKFCESGYSEPVSNRVRLSKDQTGTIECCQLTWKHQFLTDVFAAVVGGC